MDSSDTKLFGQQLVQKALPRHAIANGFSLDCLPACTNGVSPNPNPNGVPDQQHNLPYHPIALHPAEGKKTTQDIGSNSSEASEDMHVSKKSRVEQCQTMPAGQNGSNHEYLFKSVNLNSNNNSTDDRSQAHTTTTIQKPVPSVNPPAQSSWHGILGNQQSTPVPNLQSSRSSAFYDPAQSADLAARRLSVQAWGNKPLPVVDPHLWVVAEKEKQRQCKTIELVASENYASQAVIEALGCHLTNKYSEGIPGARLYCGNENIDLIENLCIERALKAFHLDPTMWGVNVQPYSCTVANFAVYTALLQPKDRIMGLDSPSGGHPSHGYYTSSRKKVSAASIYFESFPYRVNATGYIDLPDLERIALSYRPKILICGASAYPREWDYAKFRDIADRCGAILMCDMAHISGLVAAQQCNSPFEYCDIVTSTTHKSLRGPRGGIIFYRKGQKQKTSPNDSDHYDFEAKINFAVSHSIQGGPHNNRTAALAVALLQVNTQEFHSYICQVLKNAKTLAAALQRRGCKLVTGGTDNHLMLWDLRPFKLTGNQYEKVCEKCGISLNKNAVYGDSGSMAPGGVRLGTPAMTSRGCIEEDFEIIAEFLVKVVQIAQKIRKDYGHTQKGFMKGLQCNKEVDELRVSVERFALSFEMPGADIQT